MSEPSIPPMRIRTTSVMCHHDDDFFLVMDESVNWTSPRYVIRDHKKPAPLDHTKEGRAKP